MKEYDVLPYNKGTYVTFVIQQRKKPGFYKHKEKDNTLFTPLT
jgi:hypothetical protein